jgi:hypothetical protein
VLFFRELKKAHGKKLSGHLKKGIHETHLILGFSIVIEV